MKKLNVCLIVFAIVAMAAMFSGCTQGGPTDPGRLPKSQNVRVDYSRVLPVPTPEAMDVAGLNWEFGNMEGGVVDMNKIAENTFATSIAIKTETRIQVWIQDPRMWNGSSLRVRRVLKIDNQELVASETYGIVIFIYHNNGTIEVVG